MTSPGALVAAAWLAATATPRHPAARPVAGAAQPGGRLHGPLLAVCHVAAERVDATLCGVGSVASGARLVRVLGRASAAGAAGRWFATEVVRRAGADLAAPGPDGAGPLNWFADALRAASRKPDATGGSQLAALLTFAAENPQFRTRRAVRFGPQDRYELSVANLVDGFGPVEETIGRAVRDLVGARPDLLSSAAGAAAEHAAGPAGPAGPSGALVEVLLHGRTAVLPWAGAAASRAAAAALAAAGHPAQTVAAHVAPVPEAATAAGQKLVSEGRVIVEERRGHTARLRTHRIEDGRLARGSVLVAGAGDDWPRRAAAGGRPVVVQVDGSQGDRVVLELTRAGRTATGTARLTGALPPGEYQVGLLAGWEPAGSLVLSAVPDGPERLYAVTGYPED